MARSSCGLIGVADHPAARLRSVQARALLLVLMAAFGYATSNIATKKLTATQTTFTIVLWMNVDAVSARLCAAAIRLFFLKIDSVEHLLPVLGVGIAGLTAHYCLTNALAAGDASVVVPLDFMRLPLIAVVGWAFYSRAARHLRNDRRRGDHRGRAVEPEQRIAAHAAAVPRGAQPNEPLAPLPKCGVTAIKHRIAATQALKSPIDHGSPFSLGRGLPYYARLRSPGTFLMTASFRILAARCRR